MTAELDMELEAALKATEASFHVRLIGTFDPDLVWAPAEADAAHWLKNNYTEFDQFPVRDGDSTVGILLRDGSRERKLVREAMQPVREGFVVSADMPIGDLIPQLRESHCRLVLRGARIDGLVTQSDLLKLPVRMLIFGLITHLELSLRALIRKRSPGAAWQHLLLPGRRDALIRELDKLKQARFEPDPLEFTNFSDVVRVLVRQPDLGNAFSTEMKAIKNLRNDVAHAKTFISAPDDVRELADRVSNARKWIDRMSQLLKDA